MKLISMTDYVEIILKEHLDRDMSEHRLVELLGNYKDFLKTPLTLGMFVPCDEDGNVLEEPPSGKENYKDHNDWCGQYDNYQQAKGRVIFEGCIYNTQWHYFTIVKTNDIFSLHVLNNIIEDLMDYKLTLTPAKAKELGL